MICSLAAADAVSAFAGLKPALKWPNDLVLEGRKLAGVLTELAFGAEPQVPRQARPLNSGLTWAVVGIGLNVNIDFSSADVGRGWPELAKTATSLSMRLGRPVSRLALLHKYLVNVEARYDALQAGVSPHQEWATRLATLGQHVTASTPDGSYQGVAEGVDETGALLLRQPDGQIVRILTGDVTRMRRWR
jgi:BirA family biotin operon repressor/biotin-[acetyl-CoA-carboxylase] ligase